jgi:hypothetical protein
LAEPPTDAEWTALAPQVYEQTFRTTFTRPGFSLITFAQPIASETLRRRMVQLKLALADLFGQRRGRHLVYHSMARFDQQVTTKFHLDGGAEESFLMLGYEASAVESRLAMADYSQAAHALGIEPARFVTDHNPMHASGERLLTGYITPLSAFDPARDTILVINNSSSPYRNNGSNLLGVMHQATIPCPDPTRRRIINSTMLRAADRADAETLTADQQAVYITTTHISGPASY